MSTITTPDRVRSTTLLGLRGQAWVLGCLGVLALSYIIASFNATFISVGATDLPGAEWAIRLAGYGPLLLLAALSFAAAVLSLRHPVRLDPAVSQTRWWAGSWAAIGVFTTLSFVTSFWMESNSWSLVGLATAGSGVSWSLSRRRAAEGWRPGWIYWSTGAAVIPAPWVPPGWRPDPEVAGGLRWWDGYRWTEDRASAPVNGYPRPQAPAN